MNIGDLVRLINEGFEGEAVFKADVLLHGEGMTRVSYSGELAIRKDLSMNDGGRYILVSKDTKLNILFRKSGEARITFPSDGANRVSMPLALPQGYELAMDNARDIVY